MQITLVAAMLQSRMGPDEGHDDAVSVLIFVCFSFSFLHDIIDCYHPTTLEAPSQGNTRC